MISEPCEGAEAMFRELGPTLESLYITDGLEDFETYDMKMIQTFCQKLRGVEVDVSSREADALASLLMSLGSQLEFACVWELTNAQRAEVIAKCRNAGWNVEFQCQKDELTSLWTFGSRNQLPEHILGGASEHTRLVSRSKALQNMKKLALQAEFNDAGTEALKAFDLSSKTSLTHFAIYFLENSPMSDTLRCVAEGTGALRYFAVQCGVQERKDWEAVATANPLLEEVMIELILDDVQEVEVQYGEFVDEGEIVDILVPFSKCSCRYGTQMKAECISEGTTLRMRAFRCGFG